MFAAPPEQTADIFARLPPELDLGAAGAASAWLAERPMHKARPGAFLEGPAFDRHGRLFCVDVAYGRLLAVSPAGRFEVIARYGGAPNGLAIHRDGSFFIADHLRGLLRLAPEGGTPAMVLPGAFGEPFRGLNDLVFSRRGDLYFTDQGQSGLQAPTGRVFRLSAEGRLDLLLDSIPSPNGLALTRDESALLLAVTRANAIWRLPLRGDGRVTKVGVFVQMSGGGGPDGLALDGEDTLFVAAPMIGCVWAFDRYGEPVRRIRSATPGRMLTNLAFGGPGRQRLFITEAERSEIQVVPVDVPGCATYGETAAEERI
jgi:gluconolactonase